ncbi:apyrase-like [Uranotaenia lowii]|uniref:apyrase-like n=1 Tax=Uranotaenia lowii TaxID=190385 RepID=UPI002479A163|nr:apyrase-like [Uranotaenia lowii]
MVEKLQIGIPEACRMLLIFTIFTVVLATNNLPENRTILNQYFPLTIVHNNDFHARFEEINGKSKNCTEAEREKGLCVAGVARLSTTIKSLLKQYKCKNAIYLNAGDNFQGSLWFSLLRKDPYLDLFRQLSPTAMTLGNHEFSENSNDLAEYIRSLKAVGIPTVVANLKLNGERSLSEGDIPSSITLKYPQRNVSIIGVLYDQTHNIARTGKITFSDAVAAVIEEAQKLKAQNLHQIIVLSHCGIDVDMKIAAEAGHLIDMIVGAHTHSFLYPSDSKVPYDATNDVIEGDYPLIVTSAQGSRKIPIVQAKSFGKYVGRITLYFDRNGDIEFWEGAPVYVNGSVEPDPIIAKTMQQWREKMWNLGMTTVGETKVQLNRAPCRSLECSLGTVTADAFVYQWTNETFKPLGFVQGGTFRNSIPIGHITNGHILEASPFGSTVDLVQMKGEDMWSVAEHSLTLDVENRTNCLQVSGMRIRFDPTQPPYKRLISFDVSTGQQESFESLDLKASYYVAVSSFVAAGRDGFVWMKNATALGVGPVDTDVIKNYIIHRKVIESVPIGRVQICGVNWDCETDVALPLNEEGMPLSKKS